MIGAQNYPMPAGYFREKRRGCVLRAGLAHAAGPGFGKCNVAAHSARALVPEMFGSANAARDELELRRLDLYRCVARGGGITPKDADHPKPRCKPNLPRRQLLGFDCR